MSEQQSDTVDMKTLLQEVLSEAADTECETLRKRRLGAVTKARRTRLDEELGLLDEVLTRLFESDAPVQALPIAEQSSDSPVAVSEEESSPTDETPGIDMDSELDSGPPPRSLTPAPRSVSDDLDPEERSASYTAHLMETAPPTAGWRQRDEILFDDALRLFRLGDSEGALVSLERLLLTSVLNDDLSEFIVANQERLVDLYETRLGSFDSVPQRTDDGEPMPDSFCQERKVVAVLDAVDGERTYEEVLGNLGLSRLEGVMVISQLLRLGTIASTPEI